MRRVGTTEHDLQHEYDKYSRAEMMQPYGASERQIETMLKESNEMNTYRASTPLARTSRRTEGTDAAVPCHSAGAEQLCERGAVWQLAWVNVFLRHNRPGGDGHGLQSSPLHTLHRLPPMHPSILHRLPLTSPAQPGSHPSCAACLPPHPGCSCPTAPPPGSTAGLPSSWQL